MGDISVYICICLRVGISPKKLGCVIIMLGLVWLFNENSKDNLIL